MVPVVVDYVRKCFTFLFFSSFIRLHSIVMCLCTRDDYISGLDWVETWHWFYWYCTGYGGLVSQIYRMYTQIYSHTQRKQSNRSDRLYIISHEWIHTHTHIHLLSFFAIPTFSLILKSNNFFPISHLHLTHCFYAVSTMCQRVMAWHNWHARHFLWSSFFVTLSLGIFFFQNFYCFESKSHFFGVPRVFVVYLIICIEQRNCIGFCVK